MLRVDHCSVSYGVGVDALRDVSIEVPDGALIAVVGANGAGKSSLLHALSGLVTSTARAMELDGLDVRTMPTEERARRGLILVPEGRRLFANLSVRENLEVASATRRRPSKDLASAIDRVFDTFPALRDLAHRRAWSLSGGEQQMLAIGRALISNPKVLLLDEPSLGLAPLITEAVFDVIRKLNQEDGVSIVLVEQNARLALQLATHGYVIEHGAVVLEGTGPELQSAPEIQLAYLGG